MQEKENFVHPRIPTTIKTMGVNITTIVYPKGFNHPNWVNHLFSWWWKPRVHMQDLCTLRIQSLFQQRKSNVNIDPTLKDSIHL